MSNVMKFSSDQINIFLMLIDSSGSMEYDTDNVKLGLKGYKESFKGFPEANSIAVSICKFADNFNPGEFTRIDQMSTSYSAYGSTALHYSICKAAEYLNDYVKEVRRATGVVPRVTFILFSDGEPFNDKRSESDGRKAILNLNVQGVTTVFVAFGHAISSDFGKRIGFMSTIDVNNRQRLVNFLGEELSKSCKEQSQSLKALGANFFSQANSSRSEAYSNTTAQALEDDSWISDI